MGRPLSVARSAIWTAIATAIALLAVIAFLRDQYPKDWTAWAVAGATVAGVAGAFIAFKRESLGRALLWLASLIVVAFLVIFDVLDAIVDPFIDADWPVAAMAVLLVIGLGTFLSILVADDE
jgi:hypothetical protein